MKKSVKKLTRLETCRQARIQMSVDFKELLATEEMRSINEEVVVDFLIRRSNHDRIPNGEQSSGIIPPFLAREP